MVGKRRKKSDASGKIPKLCLDLQYGGSSYYGSEFRINLKYSALDYLIFLI